MAISVRAGLALYVLSALYVLPSVLATWTTSWAVQIQSASDIDVNGLAAKHGFTNLGLVRLIKATNTRNCKSFFVQIGNLEDVFHFKLKGANDVVSSNVAGHLTKKLKAEDQVCSTQP